MSGKGRGLGEHPLPTPSAPDERWHPWNLREEGAYRDEHLTWSIAAYRRRDAKRAIEDALRHVAGMRYAPVFEDELPDFDTPDATCLPGRVPVVAGMSHGQYDRYLAGCRCSRCEEAHGYHIGWGLTRMKKQKGTPT